MKNHHGGVVLVNGYLYGFNDSILTCLEFSTGKQMWRDRSVGKGAVTYADGNLYIQGENNIVGLAEASPTGYKEKGRFTIADQGLPSWAHPVVSGGRSTCAIRERCRRTTSRPSKPEGRAVYCGTARILRSVNSSMFPPLITHATDWPRMSAARFCAAASDAAPAPSARLWVR